MAERDTSIIVGDIVNKHYKLIRQIYKGERGVIFCALDTSMNQVAIKFEKIAEEQPQICVESAILKLLAGTSCIPQFIHYGSYKNYKYLAMELIGPNLIDLVNYKRPYKFSLNSILKFGIQAIEALQVFHSKGFVHRDIKPGNFLIGNTQETSGTFYLTGFGLCKKIQNQECMASKLTNESSFRGSLKYASLNAHNLVELGRNDDLMSLLYILVEFYHGILPWSDSEDIEDIYNLKQHYIGCEIVKHLPKQFLQFESHILSLNYSTDPNYSYLISLLKQAAQENEIDLNAPFEWEDLMNNERINILKQNIDQTQQINMKIGELENEKMKIDQENNDDKIEQIDQIDEEINEYKQQIHNCYQLEIKLSSLNIIHRLKKKNGQIYKYEQQEQKNITKSQSKILQKINTSHIKHVKSYYHNDELSDCSQPKQIQRSPFDSNTHSTIKQHSSKRLKKQPVSNRTLSRSSSNFNSSNQHSGTNTVKELAYLIDSLVGVDQITDQDTNETNWENCLFRQESKSYFIEQFINEMKQKDKHTDDYTWSSYIGSVNENIENEQINSFDLMSQDEILSESTSPIINEQQQHQIIQSDNCDLKQIIQESEISQFENLFQSSTSEMNQLSQSFYSSQNNIKINTQLQNESSSALLQNIKEFSDQDKQLNFPLQNTPFVERQINSHHPDSEVLPITEETYNKPKQAQNNNTFMVNKNNNKQPPDNIHKQLQYLDSDITQPEEIDLREELKQQDLDEKSNKITQREIGKKNGQESDQNIDDKLQQIISTDDIQPLLIIDITNNADNNNHNIQNDYEDFISPYSISQNNDKNNPGSLFIHNNDDNQLQAQSNMSCNLQVEQLISNTLNFTNILNIVIQEQNSTSSDNSLLHSFSQSQDGYTNTNTNSDTQFIINQSSNSQMSPQQCVNVNPKQSPLAIKYNAWESGEGNGQEERNEINNKVQIDLKKDVVNGQISEQEEVDNLQSHIQDNIQCCTIL